jgi:hypothetical protein
VSLSHTGGDVLAGVFDASSIDGIFRTTDSHIIRTVSVGIEDKPIKTKHQQTTNNNQQQNKMVCSTSSKRNRHMP